VKKPPLSDARKLAQPIDEDDIFDEVFNIVLPNNKVSRARGHAGALAAFVAVKIIFLTMRRNPHGWYRPDVVEELEKWSGDLADRHLELVDKDRAMLRRRTLDPAQAGWHWTHATVQGDATTVDLFGVTFEAFVPQGERLAWRIIARLAARRERMRDSGASEEECLHYGAVESVVLMALAKVFVGVYRNGPTVAALELLAEKIAAARVSEDGQS
jgi:hypothetical protein